MSDKKTILIIEDERHIAEGVALNLKLNGHQPIIASNGLDGLEKWRIHSPELIVLDLMMPGIDGYGVISQIREKDKLVPILVLSAKSESRDKVDCFEMGVDDYLAKPFDLDEFLQRVKRLLFRADKKNIETPTSSEATTFRFGPHIVNFDLAQAKAFGQEVRLTQQEIKVLKLFQANPNRALSRQELLLAGWGYHEETSSRTLDNFIVRLRKYFEPNPKKPIYFKSIRSIGYLFDPSPPV